MSTVEVELLEAGYSSDRILIKDIYFTIDSGKVVGLIGVNGSGKTVTIRAMLGKLPHIKGEMRIVERMGQYSYTPESPSFYEGLTMLEHIELISSLNESNNNMNKETLTELVEAFDLSSFINDFPQSFSKGMKQKFSLLLGLIKQADFYIFDNPFNDIDEKASKFFVKVIKNLKEKGCAVLIASTAAHLHDDLCDSYLYLHERTMFMSAAHNHIKVKCEDEHLDKLDCLYHLDVRRHFL